jgi:hypothetical protein
MKCTPYGFAHIDEWWQVIIDRVYWHVWGKISDEKTRRRRTIIITTTVTTAAATTTTTTKRANVDLSVMSETRGNNDSNASTD